jgi:hypothetical protein
VEKVRTTDIVAFFLALYVVSRDFADKMKSFSLCRLSRHSLLATPGSTGGMWNLALRDLSVIRQFCLIPNIVISIPFLVLFQMQM